MSTPIMVNSEGVRFVCEAAGEINTVDGLEALLLVLEKMHGRPGHVTGDTPIAAAYAFIQTRISRLTTAPRP
jgi:hypothetical protein